MDQQKPDFSTSLSAAAERQMRKWAIGLEVQERLAEKEAVKQLPRQLRPYVVISRQAGAGGGSLAKRLQQILSWDVLGRELLDRIAKQHAESRDMLEAADESVPNWLVEMVGKWLDPRLVTPSQYVRQLGRVVFLSAEAGNCIFIGRGAQCFLPAERGIAVRLVAPLEMRIARMMELRGLGHDEAEQVTGATDRKRRDFVAHQFGRNIDDPELYDLVLNRRGLDIPVAAEIVASEVQRRFNVSPRR